jgi:dsDNA-specific endonuclease/ATPase MutS2
LFVTLLLCFTRGSRQSQLARRIADDLALGLAKSEKAREKAELESASVESLRKRLDDAENALSERTAQQLAREAAIAARLESQNQRFVSKCRPFTSS